MRGERRRLALAALALAMLALVADATLFAVRSLEGSVHAEPTWLIWYQDPGTPGVVTSIDGLEASATVEVPTGIVLEKRHAIYYDTFDQQPNFTSSPYCSGVLEWNQTGHYMVVNISALGWYYDWWYGVYQLPRWYCYFYPSSLDISSYVANGSGVYAAAIMWRNGYYYVGDWLRVGFAYANDTTWDSYLIGLRDEVLANLTGDNANATAYYYNYSQGTYYVSLLNESSLPSGAYGFEGLYHHNMSAGIDFNVWDAGFWSIGLTVNSSSTLRALKAYINESYRFTPNRVGVGVDTEYIYAYTLDGLPYIYFDNFVVTVDAYPWLVNVTGLLPGWRVVLLNSTGGVVDEATAGSDGVASLSVWGYLIVPNASIEVYDDQGRLVARASFSYVVGGDVYRVERFAGRVLDIYSDLAQGFVTWLELVDTNCTLLDSGHVYIFLYNSSGAAAAPIEVVDGVIVSSSTGQVPAAPTGSGGSWLAGWIWATAYLPGGARCFVDLREVFEVAPGVYTYGRARIVFSAR